MAAEDIFIFGFVIFFIAIMITIGAVITLELGKIDIANTTTTIGNTSMNPVQEGWEIMKLFDWGFLFILVFFIIVMFVSGLLIPSHPVFAVVVIPILIAWLVISPFLSNSFIVLLDVSEFAAAAEAFPILTTVIFNLPLIGLIAGFITGVLTYGKNPRRAL